MTNTREGETTDATRCVVCGGPFSRERIIIDGAVYHARCALMSHGSHTPDDVMRLSGQIADLTSRLATVEAERDAALTKVRNAYIAGYWRWAGPANEYEVDAAVKGEQEGWNEWSAEHAPEVATLSRQLAEAQAESASLKEQIGKLYKVCNEKSVLQNALAKAQGEIERMRRDVAVRLLHHRQSQKGRCCDDCYCVALANAISEYSNPTPSSEEKS